MIFQTIHQMRADFTTKTSRTPTQCTITADHVREIAESFVDTWRRREAHDQLTRDNLVRKMMNQIHAGDCRLYGMVVRVGDFTGVA